MGGCWNDWCIAGDCDDVHHVDCTGHTWAEHEGANYHPEIGEYVLDLYHRTSAREATEILASGSMRSQECDGAVYFSTNPDGWAVSGYGDTVVHARIPSRLAQIDDEYPDGERHYRVSAGDIESVYLVREDDQ